MSEPVHVGKIVATRGNRGEVAAICSGGPPERLARITQVLVAGPRGRMDTMQLAENWAHKGRWILRFAQVESISAAEDYVGREIFLARQDLPPLPEDRFYTYELEGAAVVTADGRRLGTVKDTQEGQAHDFLLVERMDGQEAMVPMISAIILSVDAAAGKVVVDAPQGLLEGDPEVAR